MVAKRKRSTSVFTEPEYAKINCDNKNYIRQLWQLDFYCGQETSAKELKTETLTYLKKLGWEKDQLSKVSAIAEGFFGVVGKYCLAMNNDAQLCEEHTKGVIRLIESKLAAPTTEETVEEKPKAAKQKVDIQSAMWSQIESIVNELDEAIDNRNYKVDVYKLLTSNENAKAAQVRQIKSYFVEERKSIETSDGEEYNYTAAQLKKLVKFLNDIELACDTVINAKKQQRTPRKKKATPKTKIVEKVKFLKSNVELGLVSINPIDVIDSTKVWFYNDKKRKLGFYEKDEFILGLSFKGVSVSGVGRSGEKTVRKTETLKGFQKLTKAKIEALYKGLTTTEGTPSVRTTSDTIFLKKF